MSELKKPETLLKQISDEVTQYVTEEVAGEGGYNFSQYQLTRRISLFETKTYPSGKFDTQGNYKYWFDINTLRIDGEVKNIDFDTKNIKVYSPLEIDILPVIIVNLKLSEYLKATGQAEEINSAIEEGAGWGNIVWKEIKGGYERVDLLNFYVINQTARNLNETPTIERHQFTAARLRGMMGKWDTNSVQEVLDSNNKTYKSKTSSVEHKTTVPYYEVYERNGEISVKDFKEYKGKPVNTGDEKKYMLAKVIAAADKSQTTGINATHIFFVGKISQMPFKEYHRSRYKQRWWREGIYELLFDLSIRANQIGNQIAQGLELASKIVLRSEDKLIIQSILTDIRNGDIINSKDLSQVDLRMHGFDQLMSDWNRIIALANDVTNSQEVVQGITPASGVPLGTTRLVNQNAGKLFDFIREKLAIPFTKIVEDYIIPDLVKDLSQQEILRLTGDADMLKRLHELIVDHWYLNNLIDLPPHTKEIADALKKEKLDELKVRPELLIKAVKTMFKDFKPRASVIITGEQLNLAEDIQSLVELIQLEADPIRRTALIEKVMRMKGIDVEALPKTEPQVPQQQQVIQGAKPQTPQPV